MDGTVRDRCRSVLWVGGPPGQTLFRLKEKLERDGLSVEDVQAVFQHIPRRSELVLVNTAFVGHGSFDAVRAAAKRRGLPCVAAHTDYSRTRAALERVGVLPRAVPSKKNETPGVTMSDHNFSSSDASTKQETTAAELCAFIAALPKSLLDYARQEVARRAREDDVQMAAEAIATLDADGLQDLLSALPADKLALLKAALQ